MKESKIKTENDIEREQELDINDQEVLDSEKKRRFETIPVFEDRIKSELKDIEEKSKSYFSFLKKIFDQKKEIAQTESEADLEDFDYLDDLSLEDLEREYYIINRDLASIRKDYQDAKDEFRSILKEDVNEENILATFLRAQNIHNKYFDTGAQSFVLQNKIKKIEARTIDLICKELGADSDDTSSLHRVLYNNIRDIDKEIKQARGLFGVKKYANKNRIEELENKLSRLEYLTKIYNIRFGDQYRNPSLLFDFDYDDLLKKADGVIKNKFRHISNLRKESEGDVKAIIGNDGARVLTQEKLDQYILSEFEKQFDDDNVQDTDGKLKSTVIDLGRRVLNFIKINEEALRNTVEGLSSEEKRTEYKSFMDSLNSLPYAFKKIINDLIKGKVTGFNEDVMFTDLNSIKEIYDIYNQRLITDSVFRIKKDCVDELGVQLRSYDIHEWRDMGIDLDEGEINKKNHRGCDYVNNVYHKDTDNIFLDGFLLESDDSVFKERFGDNFDDRLKDMIGSIIEHDNLNDVRGNNIKLGMFKEFINSNSISTFVISFFIGPDFMTFDKLQMHLSDFKRTSSEYDKLEDGSKIKEIIDLIIDGKLNGLNDKIIEFIDELLIKDPYKYTTIAIRYWRKFYSENPSGFIDKIIQNKDIFINAYFGLNDRVGTVIIDEFVGSLDDGKVNPEAIEFLMTCKDKRIIYVDDWSNKVVDKLLAGIEFSSEVKRDICKLFDIPFEDIENPGMSLVNRLINSRSYDMIFNHLDKFINKDFSHDKLLFAIVKEDRADLYVLRETINKHINKFKDLNLDSYKLLLDYNAELCLNNLHIFKEVPEDIEIFKRVFQHGFNAKLYSDLRPIMEDGELPEYLKDIGITERGEKGAVQARELLKKSVSNLFSDNPSDWEKIINSDLMMNYLSNYVKFADSQFGFHDLASFKRVLTDYQTQQSLGEVAPVPEYMQSKTVEFAKIKDGAIPWTESAYNRFDIIMDSYRKANEAFTEGKPFTKIVQQIDEYVKNTINDLENKIQQIEKPEAKIGIQKKIDNIKSLKIRSVEDFFSNIVALSKDSELHDFLRQILFLVTLWKRPETRDDYFGDTTLDIDNATKLDEFISHIMNQEVFGSIYDKQDSKGKNKLPKKTEVQKAIQNIMNNHAINVELNQFMDKQKSDDKVEVELIPSRGPIMEFSGHIASACWASKYKSISAMFPNVTSVILKEKIDKESSRLSGAFLLIESVDENDNKVLIIRGLNPLDSLLNKVDIDDFYEKIKDYVSDMAKRDGRVPLVVSDDHSGGSSTNRPRLYSLIHFTDAKPSKKVPLGVPPRVESNSGETYQYSGKEYRGGHTFNGYDIDNVCYKI